LIENAVIIIEFEIEEIP